MNYSKMATANDTSTHSLETIVNSEIISRALMKDKGPNSSLISWNTESFTEKGDNYICLVICVTVSYMCNNDIKETSYIVKLNPCSSVIPLENMFHEVFKKEGCFYFDLVPKLNQIFQNSGQQHLKVPKTLVLEMETDKECMFMEDLRLSGFRKHDRLKGLDVIHTILALKEFARLHAVSMLLNFQDPSRGWLEKYPYLENLLETSSGMRHVFDMFFGFVYGVADVADELQGYEAVSVWIKNMLPRIYDKWIQDISEESAFLTVCHGDSWVNNFLFK